MQQMTDRLWKIPARQVPGTLRNIHIIHPTNSQIQKNSLAG